MIDPKKINMNELPKKFVDGAIGAYGTLSIHIRARLG